MNLILVPMRGSCYLLHMQIKHFFVLVYWRVKLLIMSTKLKLLK